MDVRLDIPLGGVCVVDHFRHRVCDRSQQEDEDEVEGVGGATHEAWRGGYPCALTAAGPDCNARRQCCHGCWLLLECKCGAGSGRSAPVRPVQAGDLCIAGGSPAGPREPARADNPACGDRAASRIP